MTHFFACWLIISFKKVLELGNKSAKLAAISTDLWRVWHVFYWQIISNRVTGKLPVRLDVYSSRKVCLNMAATESHFKKNARALGCDMVDFKLDPLPACRAAHMWRLLARQNCNRMWMNSAICMPCDLRPTALLMIICLNVYTRVNERTKAAPGLFSNWWPPPLFIRKFICGCESAALISLCYSCCQDGIRRGRPRADTVRELISEGETSSSRIRCNICNRVFPREKSLQAHKRTHTGKVDEETLNKYMGFFFKKKKVYIWSVSDVKDRCAMVTPFFTTRQWEMYVMRQWEGVMYTK